MPRQQVLQQLVLLLAVLACTRAIDVTMLELIDVRANGEGATQSFSSYNLVLRVDPVSNDDLYVVNPDAAVVGVFTGVWPWRGSHSEFANPAGADTQLRFLTDMTSEEMGTPYDVTALALVDSDQQPYMPWFKSSLVYVACDGGLLVAERTSHPDASYYMHRHSLSIEPLQLLSSAAGSWYGGSLAEPILAVTNVTQIIDEVPHQRAFLAFGAGNSTLAALNATDSGNVTITSSLDISGLLAGVNTSFVPASLTMPSFFSRGSYAHGASEVFFQVRQSVGNGTYVLSLCWAVLDPETLQLENAGFTGESWTIHPPDNVPPRLSVSMYYGPPGMRLLVLAPGDVAGEALHQYTYSVGVGMLTVTPIPATPLPSTPSVYPIVLCPGSRMLNDSAAWMPRPDGLLTSWYTATVGVPSGSTVKSWGRQDNDMYPYDWIGNITDIAAVVGASVDEPVVFHAAIDAPTALETTNTLAHLLGVDVERGVLNKVGLEWTYPHYEGRLSAEDTSLYSMMRSPTSAVQLVDDRPAAQDADGRSPRYLAVGPGSTDVRANLKVNVTVFRQDNDWNSDRPLYKYIGQTPLQTPPASGDGSGSAAGGPSSSTQGYVGEAITLISPASKSHRVFVYAQRDLRDIGPLSGQIGVLSHRHLLRHILEPLVGQESPPAQVTWQALAHDQSRLIAAATAHDPPVSTVLRDAAVDTYHGQFVQDTAALLVNMCGPASSCSYSYEVDHALLLTRVIPADDGGEDLVLMDTLTHEDIHNIVLAVGGLWDPPFDRKIMTAHDVVIAPAVASDETGPADQFVYLSLHFAFSSGSARAAVILAVPLSAEQPMAEVSSTGAMKRTFVTASVIALVEYAFHPLNLVASPVRPDILYAVGAADTGIITYTGAATGNLIYVPQVHFSWPYLFAASEEAYFSLTYAYSGILARVSENDETMVLAPVNNGDIHFGGLVAMTRDSTANATTVEGGWNVTAVIAADDDIDANDLFLFQYPVEDQRVPDHMVVVSKRNRVFSYGAIVLDDEEGSAVDVNPLFLIAFTALVAAVGIFIFALLVIRAYSRNKESDLGHDILDPKWDASKARGLDDTLVSKRSDRATAQLPSLA